MNKKRLIIIVSFIVIILIVFLSIFLKNKTTNPETSGDGFSLSDLFPFGSVTDRGGSSDNDTNDDIIPDVVTVDENGNVIIPRLRQVSTFPVSGATVFNTKRTRIVPIPPLPIEGDSGGDPVVIAQAPTEEIVVEDATAIRYMEQATAHIYETYTDTLTETRISNTTIPRIHDTYWNLDGGSVVFRYLEDGTSKIQTYLAALTSSSVFSEGGSTENLSVLKDLKGNFLVEGISDISVSPDKTRFFTLEPVVGGVVGITEDFLGGKKSQVVESSLSEWLSFWPNSTTLTLTTKPSGTLPGYMYSVDVNKKSFEKVLGGIVGLTTKMSPDGKRVLYSASVANGVRLYSYDLNTRLTTDLGISTLPEKCVWSKDSITVYCAVPESFLLGVYPDVWYQGRVSFEDTLWSMNLSTSVYYVLVDPTETINIPIDMTNLFLDGSEKYIFFTNKKDGILWSYSI